MHRLYKRDRYSGQLLGLQWLPGNLTITEILQDVNQITKIIKTLAPGKNSFHSCWAGFTWK